MRFRGPHHPCRRPPLRKGRGDGGLVRGERGGNRDSKIAPCKEKGKTRVKGRKKLAFEYNTRPARKECNAKEWGA